MSDNAAACSIVARCLLEPGFLDLLMITPPEVLDATVPDAAVRRRLLDLDAQQVRRFAGFISKVQHNDLWDSFPYTRALLKYYSAEIDAFAAYRDSHLRLMSEGKPTPETKARRFLAFLDSYLRSPGAPDCVGLRDVAAHERLQWEVGLTLMSDNFSALHWDGLAVWGSGEGDVWGCVPMVRGVLHVGSFEYDPLWIAARLREGGRGMEALRPRSCNLGYWGEPDPPRLHVTQLDDLSAVVLRLVDGVTPVSSLFSALPAVLPKDQARLKLKAVLDAAALEGMVGMISEVARAEVSGEDEAVPCE